MTTIAWDGKTLAADTLSVSSAFCRDVDKLWSIGKDVIYGGAGYYQDVLAVRNWLMDKDIGEPEVDENFCAIIIRNEICYRMESGLLEMPVKENYHAVGSGAPFAVVAMFLGKSSTEAVEIAAQFDEMTGGSITSISAPVVSKIVAL